MKGGIKTWSTTREVYCFIGADSKEEANFGSEKYLEKFNGSGSYVYRGYICYVGTLEKCQDFQNNKRISKMPIKFVDKGQSEIELRRDEKKQKKIASKIQKQQKIASVSLNSEYVMNSIQGLFVIQEKENYLNLTYFSLPAAKNPFLTSVTKAPETRSTGILKRQ